MSWIETHDFEDGEPWLEEFGDAIGNNLNLLRAWNKLKTKLFGRTDAALYGTPPVIGADVEWLIQVGTVVVITDASANGLVTFPEEFPNGVVTVLASSGDAVAANFEVSTVVPVARSGFDFHAAGTGGASDPVSQSIRLNYVAFGW